MKVIKELEMAVEIVDDTIIIYDLNDLEINMDSESKLEEIIEVNANIICDNLNIDDISKFGVEII